MKIIRNFIFSKILTP